MAVIFGTSSSLSGLLNTMLVAAQLGKVRLDVLCADNLAALGKLLEERLQLLLEVVVRHGALDGPDAVHVPESALAALEEAAAAVGRAAVLGGAVFRQGRLVDVFLFQELRVGVEKPVAVWAAAELVAESLPEEEAESSSGRCGQLGQLAAERGGGLWAAGCSLVGDGGGGCEAGRFGFVLGALDAGGGLGIFRGRAFAAATRDTESSVSFAAMRALLSLRRGERGN